MAKSKRQQKSGVYVLAYASAAIVVYNALEGIDLREVVSSEKLIDALVFLQEVFQDTKRER